MRSNREVVYFCGFENENDDGAPLAVLADNKSYHNNNSLSNRSIC